eukprot:35984_1
MSVQVEHLQEWIEIVYAVSYFTSAILLAIILIVQCKKVYEDLIAKGRKSISYLRFPPPLTPEYKRLAIATVLALLCSFFATAVQATMQTNYTAEQCKIAFFISSTPWTIGKGLIYIVYLLRLDYLYTGYGATTGSPRWMIYTVVLINFVMIAFVSISVYATASDLHIRDDNDETPNYCFPVPSLFVPISIVAWDFVLNVICWIMFVVSLKKTLDHAKEHKGSILNETRESKMKYVVYKYTILVAGAVVVTLVSILLSVLSRGFAFLVPLDAVWNAVIICLMSDYYPNNIYYERLCCCVLRCLRCCGLAKYKSSGSKQENTGSRDTWDVINFVHTAKGDINNDGKTKNVDTQQI